jgi:hypothetical protein
MRFPFILDGFVAITDNKPVTPVINAKNTMTDSSLLILFIR